MSVHAALVRPVFGTPRGRHAKPGPAWPRGAVRTLFLLCAALSAGAVAGWPPVLLVVPAAALVLLVAGVVKLRTAARKIDSIFAEELTRETPAEIRESIEISCPADHFPVATKPLLGKGSRTGATAGSSSKVTSGTRADAG